LKPLPAIVFSHANGFPAGTYRLLFEAWRAAGYRVHAVEKFGHDACFPVTSNWPHLRDQLLHCIEWEANGPVYLVGHSMGGYLSVLAASRRPELVRGVVLLDAPILGGLVAQMVRLGKVTGAVERYSPGSVSVRRRQHWADAEAAYAHFAAKPAFARWAPGVLSDYIACGVQAAADADGWIVALADMPWISPGTIAAVADALRVGAEIAAPRWRGERGHPVGFARAYGPLLAALTGDEGARAIVAARQWTLTPVDVDDAGAVRDVDHPADLASGPRNPGP